MKQWLWIANASATLLVGSAAIFQLVDASSSEDSSCGPNCDPHGYVVIFTAIPALIVVIVALSAVGALIARRRAGLWIALVAAIGCSGELFLLWGLLPIWRVVLLWTLIVAAGGLAVLGLRRAPVHQPYRVPEPPYPTA
ncbi:hypothetical protein ACFVWG_15680 [Kribbella sp. NPDC058245]|uniref:hypothetical protein n=1 Tax=Kribbella sp. NPDC058245 TaxID=3346399 RepID=UPI0036ECC676